MPIVDESDELKGGQSQLSRRHAIALCAATTMLGALNARPAAAFAAERSQQLARGFNLPGWLEGGNFFGPSPEVLANLSDLGFGSIRLPVDPDPLLADATTRQQTLLELEAALATLTAAGFAVMLDLHPSSAFAAAFDEIPEHADAQAREAWEALAVLVADQPEAMVFPELMNEPQMERSHWLALREQLATIVRRRCPEHTIVWGTSRYQTIGETLDTPPMTDNNTIVAVHYYSPMAFTHQCESWNDSPLARMRDLPFPASLSSPEVESLRSSLLQLGDVEALATLDEEFNNPWTDARIDSDFASLGAWSQRTGCPAILNEFGVLKDCVEPNSRANWIRAVRQAAERTCAGWTYWELDQGFGFLDDRQSVSGLDPVILRALLAD